MWNVKANLWSGFLAGALLLSACSPPIEPAFNPTASALTAALSQPETSVPASAQANPNPGAVAGTRPLPATMPPSNLTATPPAVVMPMEPSDPTRDPVGGLQHALQLADDELKAAQTSLSLPEARRHAEAVVNIIVGNQGLWYGDADGDGQIYDPAGGTGVLPAAKLPKNSTGRSSALSQAGWALQVYEMAGPSDQQLVERLIGDAYSWSNDPAGNYARIQQAAENRNAPGSQVSALPGLVEQTLAWARLILLQGQTLVEARDLAAQGAAASTAARQVGQLMAK